LCLGGAMTILTSAIAVAAPGRQLGAQHPRTGAVAGGRPFVAGTRANLIDTSTGEIAWADEARQAKGSWNGWITDDHCGLRAGQRAGGRGVFGVGGGVDDERKARRRRR
jgi:hypothetical protein